MSIGSPTGVSFSTVTIVALLNDENAWAATRSAGTPPWPRRSSPRRTVSTVTPGRSVTPMVAMPFAGAEPSCSPRSRFSGVNRQISSRPCGTSKASTSNDVKISPLVLPSRVAVRSCATIFPVASLARSADRAFHLQFDQAVELKRVLHRQFLGDRLDEAAHHHRHRLVLRHATAHQIEQLILADLRDRRLVAHRDVVLADVDVRVGVTAAD